MAPLALWVSGAADLRLLALRSVSVVGARACTAHGEEVARTWSADLASEAWTVLSGAAFGIDAAAHRGALAAGGTTVAVLAGGVDVPYPRAHAPLLARIVEEGAVVSESPPVAVAESVPADDRVLVQGVSDTMMGAAGALGAGFSGLVMAGVGYQGLNLAAAALAASVVAVAAAAAATHRAAAAA